MAQQPQVGHGIPITEGSRSHPDKPYTVGFLCTSDQSGAQTKQNTDKGHPCPRQYSNPQPQQSSGHRPRGHWDLFFTSVPVIIFCQCARPVFQTQNSYTIEKYSLFLFVSSTAHYLASISIFQSTESVILSYMFVFSSTRRAILANNFVLRSEAALYSVKKFVFQATR